MSGPKVIRSTVRRSEEDEVGETFVRASSEEPPAPVRNRAGGPPWEGEEVTRRKQEIRQKYQPQER